MRTPNATQLNALDRDRRTLNPAALGPRAMRMFELLGALLGLCLRTRSPLPFELSGYVWLQLVRGDRPSPLTLPLTLALALTPTLTLPLNLPLTLALALPESPYP